MEPPRSGLVSRSRESQAALEIELCERCECGHPRNLAVAEFTDEGRADTTLRFAGLRCHADRISGLHPRAHEIAQEVVYRSGDLALSVSPSAGRAWMHAKQRRCRILRQTKSINCFAKLFRCHHWCPKKWAPSAFARNGAKVELAYDPSDGVHAAIDCLQEPFTVVGGGHLPRPCQFLDWIEGLERFDQFLCGSSARFQFLAEPDKADPKEQTYLRQRWLERTLAG